MFGLKIFKYLLKIPALIFIIAFVVLNRQETTLFFSPLASPLTLSLWLLGLVLFAFGFIVGALLVWLNTWPIRKELRQTKKYLKSAEHDIDDLSKTSIIPYSQKSELE
jgi:uncharacterized membrane protein YciS (DUF1049 family)